MVIIGRQRFKKVLVVLIVLITSALLLSKVILRDKSQNEIPLLPPQQPVPQPFHERIVVPAYSRWTAKPCPEPQPTLLAIVHSSPSHVLHRRAIRQTWGSSPPGPNATIRTVFVVGRSEQPRLQQRVEWEAKREGDIVAIEMADSYYNLTLKHLAGLGWGLKNCPGVSFVMKVDDDAIVDVRRALKLLRSTFSENVIACRVVPQGTSPKRSGKWRVTLEDYPHHEYPEYCSGLMYLGTLATMDRLHAAALSGEVRYLWIDDVFVTGFAAGHAGVRRLDMGVWFARTEQDVIGWMRGSNGTRLWPWMVAEMSPRHWPSDALSLWNRIKVRDQGTER